ncbi:MAG: hypothetical protein HZB50_05975 [Chloroflexi bacterium]|nr:hypothetical protein [Chloroflexota bacterium]MBI5963930.1 hypothetical protein [Chloroflexota bacterium]
MKSFGELLSECRSVAGMTQKEIGDILGKHHTLISKLEKGHQAAIPDSADINLLLSEFRGRGVSEEKLESLRESWRIATATGRTYLSIEDSLIQLILKTLEGLEDSDRIAMQKDLEMLLVLWRGFEQNRKAFIESAISFRAAESEYGRLLEKKREKLGIHLEGRLRLNRGIQRRYMGNTNGSESDLLEAKDIAKQIGEEDPRFYAAALLELGDFYRRLDSNKWSDAKACYLEARNMLKAKEGDRAKATTEIRIASINLFAGLPLEALPLCEESLKYAEFRGDRNTERKALEHKAWGLSMLGHLDEGLNLQLQAYQIAKELDLHPKEMAKSCRYIGDFYLGLGMLEEAEHFYKLALDYVEETRKNMREVGEEKEKLIRVMVLYGLGGVYLKKLEKKRLVRSYLGESLEIALALGDAAACGLCFNRLGEFELVEGSTESARTNFNKAEAYFKKSGLTKIGTDQMCNPYYLSLLSLNRAELEYIEGRYDKSLQCLEITNHLAQEFGFTAQHIKADLWRAKLMLIGNKNESQQILELYYSLIIEVMNVGPHLVQYTLANTKSELISLHNTNEKLSSLLLNLILEEWPKRSLSKAQKKYENEMKNWYSLLKTSKDEWETVREATKANTPNH